MGDTLNKDSASSPKGGQNREVSLQVISFNQL